MQGALTEPNDPIASKVKTMKVSSTGGMPRVVLEGKNIAEFVYNRGEPSVQFEQARAQHAKATGIPTPVSPIPSPRAKAKKNQNESDSEGFHSADEEESDYESSEYSGSSDYESSDYEDAGPGYISSAAGALGKLFSRG